MERKLVSYENNKLIIESLEGLNVELEKSVLKIPVRLQDFSLHEKFILTEVEKITPELSLSCRVVDLDLSEFSTEINNWEGNEEYELWDEVRSEIKILSDKTTINRIKTDIQSLFCVIRQKADGQRNYIKFNRRGFFASVTLNFILPNEIFDRLIDTWRQKSLQSIDMDVEVEGFNLGYKLGEGLSGLLIENEERFKVDNLSISLSNPNEELLSALNFLTRKIHELINNDEQ